MNRFGRSLMVALLCVMPFAAVAAVGTIEASAAQTVTSAAAPQATPIHCSGDVCAQVTGLSGDTVSIKVWCNNSAFVGHFDLVTPGGALSHWPTVGDGSFAPGSGHVFKVLEQNGTYTAKAWAHISGSDFQLIGQIGFPVTM